MYVKKINHIIISIGISKIILYLHFDFFYMNGTEKNLQIPWMMVSIVLLSIMTCIIFYLLHTFPLTFHNLKNS